MTGTARPTMNFFRRLAPAAVFAFLVLPTSALATSAPTDTLLVVNGDVVTAIELDRLIMEGHAMFRMEEETSGLVDKILNKRTNDLLIIQDALAAGMDEEAAQVALVTEKKRQYAIEAYVDANFQRAITVPEDSTRAFFERYYWQIQMRRISVRTQEEAEQLRADVLAGADMDALARELSLDTKKPTGGLYRLLYWADVENRIREQVYDLKEGEMSEVFPYNDAFTFIRIEKRTGLDEDAFPKFEASINAAVTAALQEEHWNRFVDEHIDRCEIAEDLGGLAAIMADSSLVIRGEFIRNQTEPVMEVAGGGSLSGLEMRRFIQEEAMQDAMQPFAVHLEAARHRAAMDLALDKAARDDGFYDNPEIVSKVARDQEQALIQAYLTDTVASKITFKRQELDDFYEENKERFRGPQQYRLDIMILDDQAKAEEAAARLAEGADFAFIWREYIPGEEPKLGQANFITAEQLSEPFRVHLKDMQPGDTSPAIDMPMGWMIFKLDAVREGQIAPIEKVEMEIRRVVYQLKFNELLDEHLALLKEQSVIERHEDRIEAYILAGE